MEPFSSLWCFAGVAWTLRINPLPPSKLHTPSFAVIVETRTNSWQSFNIRQQRWCQLYSSRCESGRRRSVDAGGTQIWPKPGSFLTYVWPAGGSARLRSSESHVGGQRADRIPLRWRCGLSISRMTVSVWLSLQCHFAASCSFVRLHSSVSLNADIRATQVSNELLQWC